MFGNKKISSEAPSNALKHYAVMTMAVKARMVHKYGGLPTQELMRFVRGNYNRQEDVPYEPVAVHRRSSSTFLACSLEEIDHFLEVYKRRSDNKTLGFFSPQEQPYKPLGEIVLDPESLVIDELRSCLDEDALKQYEKAKESKLLTYGMDEKSKRKSVEHEGDASKAEWEKRRYQSSSAGMKSIREMIKESDQRIIAVRAGQHYAPHVLNCKAEKSRARAAEEEQDNMDGMTMKRLSSHFLLDTIATKGIDQKEETNTVPMEFPSASPRPRLPNTPRGKQIASNPRGSEERKSQMPRKENAFRGKVEAVHRILCILYNMKSRLLRQRTPLTRDMLNSLYRDPFVIKKLDISKLSRRNGRCSPSSSAAVKITAASSQEGLTTGIRPRPGSSKHEGQFQGKSPSRISLLGSREVHTPTGASRFSRIEIKRRHMLGGERMESWEDLLNVNIKDKSQKVSRKFPPWFTSFTENKQSHHKTDEKIYKSNSDCLESVHDSNTVNRFRTDMVQLRESLQSRAKHRNNKVESEKLPKFRMKIALLDPASVSSFWEKQRIKLDEVDNKDIKDVVCVQDVYPEWYEAIVSECSHLHLDEDTLLKPIMNSLENFAREDISALPNIKEKLILLVMSLPVMDVCTASIQQALKVVLGEVLNLDTKLFAEWLKFRKLHEV